MKLQIIKKPASLFILFFFSFAFLLCATLSNAQSFGYTNPIISGMNPDPSICRVGEDYYTVTSTFLWFPGVPVYHSKDLVNWELIGYSLSRKSQLDLSKGSGIYAPVIRYNKGTFYMITTNRRNGENFFVTATNPAGPWSDPIWVEMEGIDPSLFFDDDGKVYFTCAGNNQCEIDIKTGKRLSEIKCIWGGTGGRYPEGPHLYKINGYYYLLISEGGTEYGHFISIARSNNPWGPFESNPNNPILTHRNRNAQSNPIQGTGHADMLQAHDGSWWMVFLAFRANGTHHHIGRETYLVPLSWSSNGWPLVYNGGTADLKMNVATLPQKPFAKAPEKDEFEGNQLDLKWNYSKNPDVTAYSLSDRKGWLRLKPATETFGGNGFFTFIGQRQTDLNFKASVQIDFNPVSENEEAGLTVYHRPEGHYDVFIQRQKAKRFIVLRYKLGSITHEEKRLELKEDLVQIVISGNKDMYTFECVQGTETLLLGKVETKFISSETLGGFVGAYIGLYATGNGKKSTTPADFNWFSYKGEDK